MRPRTVLIVLFLFAILACALAVSADNPVRTRPDAAVPAGEKVFLQEEDSASLSDEAPSIFDVLSGLVRDAESAQ